MPDFALEDACESGLVCGLDEVGRGPLAGPVVAACVHIPVEKRGLDFVGQIKDSKKLSGAKLAMLDREIRAHFVFGIAEVTPEEIDRVNILQASLRAMVLAYEDARVDMGLALVDGNRCPKELPCPAMPVVKGDARSVSIAAASIIAKVHRDTIMRFLGERYPYYGWANNAGYPTKEHLEALEVHGVTEHHRKSFGPVRRQLSC
ncbi:MAG: ribonuclease HII [Alphaproteobacteria bacterium]|nr:ribonuclease HII [Alphaproteobacteria bacterium]